MCSSDLMRSSTSLMAGGDIQAIKEVLDRIDGKTVPGPDDGGQGARQVNIRWKDANPSSTAPS